MRASTWLHYVYPLNFRVFMNFSAGRRNVIVFFFHSNHLVAVQKALHVSESFEIADCHRHRHRYCCGLALVCTIFYDCWWKSVRHAMPLELFPFFITELISTWTHQKAMTIFSFCTIAHSKQTTSISGTSARSTTALSNNKKLHTHKQMNRNMVRILFPFFSSFDYGTFNMFEHLCRH